MASDEFDIIRRYFQRSELAFAAPGVALGIGDDCALLRVGPGQELVMSMDLLQEGVHFLPDSDPYLLGQRVLLVNLSDLAAMGAQPVCFTLALSLPNADPQWLERFSAGLGVVASAHACPLVGGDTTACHPDHRVLTVCIQVHGSAPQGAALLRNGAQEGDMIYVTGTLGDAAAGLMLLQGRARDERATPAQRQALIAAFHLPESRVRAALRLRQLASAAIDISDGLASDLGHIARASGLGAVVNVDALPLSEAFRALIPPQDHLALALGGGDDYELCFTVPSDHTEMLEQQMREAGTPVACIGHIAAGSGVRWQRDGETLDLNVRGYNHFPASGTAASSSQERR
ncbi:MAG: thiamine-phosphate kinase [Gammaproteobacteria bacterium]|nr:thiamine-phosphate kinase [Gammaproteobacteria bacterium]